MSTTIWLTAMSGTLLLAKSWALGYALTFLGVFLGALAVLIPSLRKSLQKKS